MSINWQGNKVKKRVKVVTAKAINQVIADSIKYALNHHPQWKFRTGVAEGSITQKDFATPNKLVGLWGSIWSTAKKVKGNTSNYVWYLEFKHGSFLRGSADVNYKDLVPTMRKLFKRK